MDYLQKPETFSKSLVHLSKVSIYVNEQVSVIRMKSLCPCSQTSVKSQNA